MNSVLGYHSLFCSGCICSLQRRNTKEADSTDIGYIRPDIEHDGKTVENKSNSTAGAVQVEANLQEQLNDHMHVRN